MSSDAGYVTFHLSLCHERQWCGTTSALNVMMLREWRCAPPASVISSVLANRMSPPIIQTVLLMAIPRCSERFSQTEPGTWRDPAAMSSNAADRSPRSIISRSG
jgi:hypothetical protein